MKNIVYKVTNEINGKIYVGATTRGLNIRASEHRSQALTMKSNSLLHKAIREYGWENFSLEIIENCDSREEMFEREAHFIKECESNIFGYNISSGYGSSGISPNHKGKNNPNSRLSEAEVIQIKILLMDKSRSMNQFEIAELYGISHKTVSHINCGRLWSSISVEVVA